MTSIQENILIKDRVSVIVASYNHVSYLKERMDSLINQTFKNLEIIVIDDNSPDKSVEFLKNYESDPRVRIIINTDNLGWIKNSNKGASLATGEYLLFANCDDYCDITMVEKLVNIIKVSQNASIAFCKSLMVDSQSKVYGDDYSVREKSFRKKCRTSTLINNNEMKEFLMHSCVLPNLSSVLMKTSIFLEAGGFSEDFKVCSDWSLFFQLSNTYNFAYEAEPLNYFRQHRNTVRNSVKDRVIYDEYFKLITRNIKEYNVSYFKKIKFYFLVSRLWTKHLCTMSGLKNLNVHFFNNLKYSIEIVILLPLAFAYEIPLALSRKLLKRL